MTYSDYTRTPPKNKNAKKVKFKCAYCGAEKWISLSRFKQLLVIKYFERKRTKGGIDGCK